MPKLHFVAVFSSSRDTTSHLPYNDATNDKIIDLNLQQINDGKPSRTSN